MAESYLGRCYCGAVEYEIERPLKFVVHDHCSICRRIAGAAFVTWCGVREEQFRMIRGEESITRFQSTPEAVRSFCRACGSHLFFRSSRWPGEVHVTRATLVGPLEEQPTAHVFFSDKADWIEIADRLPRCGGASGVEPLPVAGG